MNTFKLLAIVTAIPFFSACTTLGSQDTQAEQTGRTAQQTNPFAAFERSRQSEADFAEQTRQALLSLLSKQKNVHQTVVEPVEYADIVVTDSKSQQTKPFRVVSNMKLSLSLSLKSLPAYDQCIAMVDELAAQLADGRGASEVQYYYNPADVKAQKISLTGGVSNSSRNNPITVTKSTDAATPRGVLRLVIKGVAVPGKI